MRPRRVALIATTADADGIAKSQSAAGAQALTLNGDLIGGDLDIARRITITSASNDTGRTFTVAGVDRFNQEISESLAGASGAAVMTEACFLRVTSVTTDGATAGNVQVGTADAFDTAWCPLNQYADLFNVTVDVARQAVGGSAADFTYGLQFTLSDVQAKDFRESDAHAVDHATMTAKTADDAVNLTMPVTAVRIRVTSYVAGALVAQIQQAGGPLS